MNLRIMKIAWSRGPSECFLQKSPATSWDQDKDNCAQCIIYVVTMAKGVFSQFLKM